MTGANILLDTNIDNVTQVFISATVIGELYYGAQYSTHIEKNTYNIHELIKVYEVLMIDEETAKAYGTIKASLRKKGRPILENDIWIAAIALQYNLTLATRDRHFSEIEQLDVVAW